MKSENIRIIQILRQPRLQLSLTFLREGIKQMKTNNVMAFWRPWTDPGLEHLRITYADESTVAEGTIVRVFGSVGYHATYRVTADAAWKFRGVNLIVSTDHDRHLSMTTDGEGHWQDELGNELSHLEGCFEIDISATPFTNTLAISRLQLRVGESADLSVVYIRLPELTVEAVSQRYTALERGKERSTYRYDGLFRKFTADLPVDRNLLVLDYPETFRRVYPLT